MFISYLKLTNYFYSIYYLPQTTVIIISKLVI